MPITVAAVVTSAEGSYYYVLTPTPCAHTYHHHPSILAGQDGEHPVLLDGLRHEAQQKVVEEIHEHLDGELTLGLRSICGLLYLKSGQLRHMLGFKSNAKGKLERIEIGLRKTIRMPTTATGHVVKKIVKEIVDVHGIKVNFDTKTVSINIKKMLKEKLLGLDTIILLSRTGLPFSYLAMATIISDASVSSTSVSGPWVLMSSPTPTLRS